MAASGGKFFLPTLPFLYRYFTSAGYPLSMKPENESPVNLIKGVCTMNKTIVVMLLVLAALTVFSTGVALAQAPQPVNPGNGGGMGMGNGAGPMGPYAITGQAGPLHDYMVNAMAEALGISPADFEARQAAGKTAYQMALDLGISADKIPTLLSGARAKALDAAVADGGISQQQADWMKSRGAGGAGMGQGNCSGTGQPVGPGTGRGGRWQQANP
jgi:hypothetical protein